MMSHTHPHFDIHILAVFEIPLVQYLFSSSATWFQTAIEKLNLFPALPVLSENANQPLLMLKCPDIGGTTWDNIGISLNFHSILAVCPFPRHSEELEKKKLIFILASNEYVINETLHIFMLILMVSATRLTPPVY